MMDFLNTGAIREIFFFAVRFLAALAGFFVGYMLTGPILAIASRVLFRKPVPQWIEAWAKVIVGILVALLVFFLVPIGGAGPGGGGKGSGGGTGDGKGPGTGSGKPVHTGQGPGSAASTGTNRVTDSSGILVIEMLGPDTAIEDRCYLLQRQQPPVNYEAVETYVQKNRQRITGIEIVFTEQSVSRNDPVVAKLYTLARDQGLEPPTSKILGVKKQ